MLGSLVDMVNFHQTHSIKSQMLAFHILIISTASCWNYLDCVQWFSNTIHYYILLSNKMAQGNTFMFTVVEHSNHRYQRDITETRYEILNVYIHWLHDNSTKTKEWIAKSLPQTNKISRTEQSQTAQRKNKMQNHKPFPNHNHAVYKEEESWKRLCCHEYMGNKHEMVSFILKY